MQFLVNTEHYQLTLAVMMNNGGWVVDDVCTGDWWLIMVENSRAMVKNDG